MFDCYVNEVHKDGCLTVMLMKCIRMVFDCFVNEVHKDGV